VVPVIGLIDQRYNTAATASEDKNIYGDPGRVFPVIADDRAVRRKGGKAGIGWAASTLLSGVQSRPFQSMRCEGTSLVIPSHQTSPSSVRAQLVKITFSLRSPLP